MSTSTKTKTDKIRRTVVRRTPEEKAMSRSAFGKLVLRFLRERDLSVSDFARQVRKPVSTIDFYMTKGPKPPLKVLHLWSAKLGLTDDEKTLFYETALCEHLGREGVRFLFRGKPAAEA
jgi:hypothetical protein